jgi:hypothetical protein
MARPYDATHNGADARKSRKLTDRLDKHAPTTAYVLSDTNVYQDDKLIAVKRTTSKLVVRNGDSPTQDTLALASRLRLHRASKGR